MEGTFTESYWGPNFLFWIITIMIGLIPAKIAANKGRSFEEEPINGSVVFVCYGPQNRWLVRWYYTKPNGTIILRAANREYPEIEITQEEVEMGWFTYVGKVVAIYGTPRAGI